LPFGDTLLGDVEREFWSAAELRVPAGKKIHMKEAAEQVVELFRAPASAGCCCCGSGMMPCAEIFPASAMTATAPALFTPSRSLGYRD
jgi:hypothetical protein